MTDEPTCGTGVASHAPLPAALAELTAATAGVLEHHMPSLDLTDDGAREEHRAYASLAAAHREASQRLEALASTMAACANLPSGPHDIDLLTTPANTEAYRRFVAAERTLLTLLQSRLPEDEAMLAEMEI